MNIPLVFPPPYIPTEEDLELLEELDEVGEEGVEGEVEGEREEGGTKEEVTEQTTATAPVKV